MLMLSELSPFSPLQESCLGLAQPNIVSPQLPTPDNCSEAWSEAQCNLKYSLGTVPRVLCHR